ncbi:MAG: MaoC family dehydratase, partial [Chloroflexota bacterium]
QNQHTDEAIAKSLGRPGIIAQGLQISALVHELLTQGFGAAWMRGGALKVRFLKMVVSGDTLTVSGRVSAVEPLPDADRVTINVQIQNQRGDVPLVGTATVRVARR